MASKNCFIPQTSVLKRTRIIKNYSSTDDFLFSYVENSNTKKGNRTESLNIEMFTCICVSAVLI